MLKLKLTYNQTLLEPVAAERMLSQYRNLLERMIRAPESKIRDILTVSSDERASLTSRWAGSARDYGEPREIVGRFALQASSRPRAVAASCRGDTLTYAELDAKSDRLAHDLVRRGVGPETLVALLDERGLDFLVMALAVFKAGGAYLPLDPAHPDGRIAQIVAESEAPALLVGSRLRDRAEAILGAIDEPTTTLIELASIDCRPAPQTPPRRRHGPENLAFVIFTSGSTGKPKGAMIEHRGMINNLLTKIPALGLSVDDVVAQTASQCFDISVWQFFTPLAVGARVEIFPDEISRDPERLCVEIDARGVTILEAVPSMIAAVLDAAPASKLATLRWLLPCGEAFAPELCRRFMARYPHIRLLNAYGPAECSDDVSYHPIDIAPEGDELSVPIGRAVDNTTLYVLDRRQDPAPLGVAGEICVAGLQVGRGYLGRPDLTAAAFVPDPLGPPGGRLYRTGDLGRGRDDGALDFLGRVDHQVKIRGHRIEPGEIDARLLSHPAVRAAATLTREQTRGAHRLVSHVVGNATPDELRRHLRASLPDYMIPSAFVILDALPLTPNGKLDRKALPDPDFAASAADRHAPPTTETEKILARIWADVLRIDDVGVHHNFFELGGHSLLTTQIASRIRGAFDVDVPLRVLFETRTVAEMAEVVDARRTALVDSRNGDSNSSRYEIFDL
jgi:amino acid adenylation domain-containing protein